MLVELQVLGQVVNTLGQQRNLCLRGASVGLVQAVLLEDVSLLLSGQCHECSPWVFQFALEIKSVVAP